LSRPGGSTKAEKQKHMKTFLVVAGLLMTGASVYGIVDYNKKADTKAFKELYNESAAPVEAEVEKEKVVLPVVEKKEDKNRSRTEG
jgi:hypothetical protein